MGEQERPGESQIRGRGEVPDELDTEGQGIRLRVTSDEGIPGPNDVAKVRQVADEDDSAGHGFEDKGELEGSDEPTDEGEAEGHRFKFKAAPDTDQPPADTADTEGHRRYVRPGEGSDEPRGDREAEGHGSRGNATPDEGDKADTEGHALRSHK